VCARLCSIFGTYTAASDVKKTFTLPRTMMTNSDLARIINSDEIQTKVSSFPQPSLLPRLLAFAPARRGRVLPWSDMSAGICCLSLPSSPTLLPALLRLPLCGAQVRDARAGFAKPSRKRNPLKNLGTMLKLNPYVAQVSSLHEIAVLSCNATDCAKRTVDAPCAGGHMSRTYKA
jgi:hypothetical protein